MMRMKISFSKSAYQELLDIVRRINRDLRDVTCHNMALESMKNNRRSKGSLAKLKQMRQHAANLYRILIVEQKLRCTCKLYHLASMQLEARLKMTEGICADAQGFRILLSVVEETRDLCPITRWAEIEVIPSTEDQVPTKRPVDPASDDHPSNLFKPPHVKQRLVKRRQGPARDDPAPDLPESHHVEHRDKAKAVIFADQVNSCVADRSNSRASVKADISYIRELCSLMSDPGASHRDVGVLVDEARDKSWYKVKLANAAYGSACFSKSLGDILGNPDQGSVNGGLLRRDRLHIAVILAFSVLQLDGSSWLKSQWSTYDILFQCKDGSPRPTDYSRPYLSWQGCHDTAVASMDRLNLNNDMIRSEVLLALGLALVELCFGR